MNERSHVGEAAGAYVLGALNAEDAKQIEAHAQTCVACREELSQLRQVVSVLPLACSLVQPSSELKAKVMAAGRHDVEAEALLRGAAKQPARDHRKPDFWRRPAPSLAGIAGWIGVAAACAVAGVFIGVSDEHHRMLAQQSAGSKPIVQSIGKVTTARAPSADSVYEISASQIKTAVALVGHAQVWDFSVSRTGERIPCKVIQMPHDNHAMLVSDMPPSSDGRVYRVWLIRKGEMHRGGIVPPGKMMETTIPMRVKSGDVLAFSMEMPGAGGGSAGHFVMQQTL